MKTTDEIIALADKWAYMRSHPGKAWDYAEPARKTLRTAIEKLSKDAERYQWLCTNVEKWSWQPSRYNAEVISGFSAKGTGYIGHRFGDAVDAAMWEKTP